MRVCECGRGAGANLPRWTATALQEINDHYGEIFSPRAAVDASAYPRQLRTSVDVLKLVLYGRICGPGLGLSDS